MHAALAFGAAFVLALGATATATFLVPSPSSKFLAFRSWFRSSIIHAVLYSHLTVRSSEPSTA